MRYAQAPVGHVAAMTAARCRQAAAPNRGVAFLLAPASRFGKRLSPLPAPRWAARIFRPDCLPKPLELKWLQDECWISDDALQRASLESIGTNVSSTFAATSKPGWVIPVGNQARKSFGPAYCPQCLAEDRTPHFRASWRFAFLGVVPRHDLPLDQCPQCRQPLWPANIRLIENWDWDTFLVLPTLPEYSQSR